MDIFPSLGNSARERKEMIVFNESLPFLFFTAASHWVPPLHINAATHTITNAFMCLRQRSVGKEGQLLIIKRYLFGSCGVLNSSYIWPFFCHISSRTESPAHVVQQQSPRVNQKYCYGELCFLVYLPIGFLFLYLCVCLLKC